MRLAVTLVTGLHDGTRRGIARAMAGGSRPESADAAGGDGNDGEFAAALADRLVGLALDGQRGAVVVDLSADTEIVEVGLVLEAVFAEHERHIALRDVVAVATASDVRTLLFRDGVGDDAREIALAERLALQLEFATVVVVAAAAEVTAAEMLEIRGLLRKLNPAARRLQLARNGELRPLDSAAGGDVGGTPAPFGRSAGWMLELGGALPPTTADGIGCLVYRDPRPFHPVRLAAVVEGWLEPDLAGLIVRSRGLVRLATRADRVGSWSTAGSVLALDPTSMTSWDRHSPLGQELVFFGRDLNRDYIVRALDCCLLSDDEMLAGPMEWATYYDPFPVWDLEHDH
jgi:G3E family GTPase